MSLLLPDSGLLFWMILSFGIVFFVLAKFGFPVITKMVEERREYISKSMKAADEANQKLDSIRTEADSMISQAHKEQLRIINEASRSAEQIISDAKIKAITEGQKHLDEAKRQIKVEKDDAIREIRSQVASLSVDIAEKILRSELDTKLDHMNLINRMIDEIEAPKS